MVSKEQVLEALRAVQDPELRRSIVELGMVHDIEISDHCVSLTLALTTMACPLRGSIVDSVRSALTALDGVGDVQVKLREMTAEEKDRIFKSRSQKPEAGAAAHLNRDRERCRSSGEPNVVALRVMRWRGIG